MKATYQDLKLLLELGIVEDIHDDMYRGFSQGSISHAELLEWVTPICNKYGIEKWSLNKEGLVDVNNNITLYNRNLTRLPLRFGKVNGGFSCSRNLLTSLEGSPKKVDGFFECRNNRLTTLVGAPKLVSGGFWCHNNYLTTLEGAPKEVGGDFWCRNNPLTTLDGIGKVKGHIYSDIK